MAEYWDADDQRNRPSARLPSKRSVVVVACEVVVASGCLLKQLLGVKSAAGAEESAVRLAGLAAAENSNARVVRRHARGDLRDVAGSPAALSVLKRLERRPLAACRGLEMPLRVVPVSTRVSS